MIPHMVLAPLGICGAVYPTGGRAESPGWCEPRGAWRVRLWNSMPCPGGATASIGLSEGPDPGSNPGRDTESSSECGGQHPTLRRSEARFDSWRGCLRAKFTDAVAP